MSPSRTKQIWKPTCFPDLRDTAGFEETCSCWEDLNRFHTRRRSIFEPSLDRKACWARPWRSRRSTCMRAWLAVAPCVAMLAGDAFVAHNAAFETSFTMGLQTTKRWMPIWGCDWFIDWHHSSSTSACYCFSPHALLWFLYSQVIKIQKQHDHHCHGVWLIRQNQSWFEMLLLIIRQRRCNTGPMGISMCEGPCTSIICECTCASQG